MKQIYLAGAMETYGTDTDKASSWRNKIKEYFEWLGDSFKCVSPTDYYEYGTKYHTNEAEVMRFDLRKVRECDIVLVNLSNLRKSIGTSDEIFYAYMSGKPIIGFVEENFKSVEELITYVHPWKYEQIDRIETGADAMAKACEYIINYYE